VNKRDIRFLQGAHQGEVFGEAAYGIAARLDRAHREAWEMLRDVERQTKESLAARLAVEGVPANERGWAKALGVGAGLALAPLSWRTKLRLVGAVTGLTLRLLRGPVAALRTSEPALADSFEEHERVQNEYVRRALAGEPHALDGVVTLLSGAASGEA
jgi:hypothetical protein